MRTQSRPEREDGVCFPTGTLMLGKLIQEVQAFQHYVASMCVHFNVQVRACQHTLLTLSVIMHALAMCT